MNSTSLFSFFFFKFSLRLLCTTIWIICLTLLLLLCALVFFFFYQKTIKHLWRTEKNWEKIVSWKFVDSLMHILGFQNVILLCGMWGYFCTSTASISLSIHIDDTVMRKHQQMNPFVFFFWLPFPVEVHSPLIALPCLPIITTKTIFFSKKRESQRKKTELKWLHRESHRRLRVCVDGFAGCLKPVNLAYHKCHLAMRWARILLTIWGC